MVCYRLVCKCNTLSFVLCLHVLLFTSCVAWCVCFFLFLFGWPLMLFLVQGYKGNEFFLTFLFMYLHFSICCKCIFYAFWGWCKVPRHLGLFHVEPKKIYSHVIFFLCTCSSIISMEWIQFKSIMSIYIIYHTFILTTCLWIAYVLLYDIACGINSIFSSWGKPIIMMCLFCIYHSFYLKSIAPY